MKDQIEEKRETLQRLNTCLDLISQIRHTLPRDQKVGQGYLLPIEIAMANLRALLYYYLKQEQQVYEQMTEGKILD